MRLKKLISGVLAGLTAISSITFSSAGIVALAADEEKDIWDGTIDTSWYNSEEKEFHISTPEELAGLAELVNDGKKMSGQTFVLDNDICLNNVSGFENWESIITPKNKWKPIGMSNTYCFSGIFDGAGFSIEGLYISGSDYQYIGLFGCTTNSSEIKNVNTAYEYINNKYGSKCYAGGITAYSNGKINNCINNGTISPSSDQSDSYGGGIAGYSSAEIKNCTNNGSVISSSSSSSRYGFYSYGGGITGYSSAEIKNCTNNGSVSSASSLSSSESYGGGIAGYSTAEISNCTNSGTVTSSSSSHFSYGGGIAGYSEAEISNCTNSGTVSSSSSYFADNYIFESYGGGIAGYSKAEINNCTNSGTVYSSSKFDSYGGGIAACSFANISNCTNSGNIISSCYSSSLSYGGGIVGGSYCPSDVKEIIISNVYNAGNAGKVTAEGYEGGIVGYTSSGSSSYKLTINNAYNIGKVSAAILGGSKYSNGFTIINSSYLIGQSEQGCKDYTDDEKIVAKSKEEMQTKEFAESLGDAFVYVEGDYPKLAWEVNGNIEEPTEITSETISEDTSNIENTTDISETESISTDITDITESPSEYETTTTSKTKATTVTSSYVTSTSTTTKLPVTTMETSTAITKGTTSTEVTKLSTTITTTTTESLKAEIDSIEIEVGEKTTIKANQDNLIFKTSNSDVAIVSKTGVITPISAGTAIISVINSDGDSVQIKIEVKDSSLETTAIKTTEKITVATTTTTNKSTTEKTTSVTTTIVNPTTIVTTKPTIKISVGDVNDDGIIDSKDAVFVLKSYAETLAGNVATVSIEKGDVNGDGKIDSKDAVKILKYYASTMVGYKGNIVNFN